MKFVEFVGIGPGPFAAMLLSDLGAEVIRIDRISASGNGIARPVEFDFAARGRSNIALDLKDPAAIELVLDLIAQADGLVEGFRPGVMERLGLGPDVCLERNPALAYGRLTGWGQTGPLAMTAGHDLTYLALTGVLNAIGRPGQAPVAPINLVGDFAGGSLFLVIGLLAAVHSARLSGQGQVVDSAIVDGVNLLALPLAGLIGAGIHDGARGENLLDGGAPHYDSYICADGRYLAIAPIEGKFRRELLTGLGFDPDGFPDVGDKRNWPEARRLLAARIAERSRDDWAVVFAESDACAAPVLDFDEAAAHSHAQARAAYVDVGGHRQPAPAPRFSHTPPDLPTPPQARGAGYDALSSWGISRARISQLQAVGAKG
ncbi:CaiB/BaiF CoA-transferase family protein [Pseudooceanicola sp.]|uniref:CaiB/BaiF CoA transferase family protein n=1 Tax=Pseudooceanicola sp. TaxID=1914328 RepID=UPI00262B57B5|nr:CaiB/BaiF CoA-transferase family protein [Pseudooceanicola sp.]MDF1855091.1 CaiB/BaiF CoA-transferase family protein [Pseudooceanicola sp.]